MKPLLPKCGTTGLAGLERGVRETGSCGPRRESVTVRGRKEAAENDEGKRAEKCDLTFIESRVVLSAVSVTHNADEETSQKMGVHSSAQIPRRWRYFFRRLLSFTKLESYQNPRAGSGQTDRSCCVWPSHTPQGLKRPAGP